MWWRMFRTKYARDLVLGAALALTTLGFILFPRECVAAARTGLELCFNVIIPSLFPFFVLSSLVVDLGLAGYIGRALERVMRPLFRVSGSCASALALGFVGGYPVGAQTAISLYRQGMCTRTEAQRLLAFCNNSGPAFILGVVGAGIFADSKVGLLLYLVHMASSCLVGVLFRFYGPKEEPGTHGKAPTFQAKRFTTAFTQAVTGAMGSTINICAFVIFFTVILRLLSLAGFLSALAAGLGRLLGPFGLTESWCQKLLTGLIELTSGVSGLTQGGQLVGQVSMAAFMLGWAGLSIHCQTLSFLSDSGLSPGTYFVGKLLHGGISAALVWGFVRLFPPAAPVGVILSQQVDAMAQLDFSTAFTGSVCLAWCLLLVFFFFSIFCSKKRKRVV